MMIEAEREPDAVNLLNGFQKRSFLQRPESRRWSARTGRHQQAIHRAPCGFIGRFHARDIRVRAHVVRSQEKILQFHLGFRPVLQRTRGVDQQRFGIRGRARVGKLNVRIEKPRKQVRIVNWAGNPDKPAIVENGSARLHPRKSFELWKNAVTLHSKRWEPSEVAAVIELNAIFRELIASVRK